MATNKQLHHIATNPHAYARFHMTGQLPAMVRPKSPLITLLEALTPRERMAIVGLTVNERLGYLGNRQFHTAEVALRWLKPDSEMLTAQSWPAESHRIKRFAGSIYLDELVIHSSRVPDGLLARYPRLRDPALVRAERAAIDQQEAPSSEAGAPESPSP